MRECRLPGKASSTGRTLFQSTPLTSHTHALEARKENSRREFADCAQAGPQLAIRIHLAALILSLSLFLASRRHHKKSGSSAGSFAFIQRQRLRLDMEEDLWRRGLLLGSFRCGSLFRSGRVVSSSSRSGAGILRVSPLPRLCRVAFVSPSHHIPPSHSPSSDIQRING